MERHRIAVVGLGRIGVLHTALLSTLHQSQVACVVDSRKAKAGYARSLGIQAPFFTSIEQALTKVPIDGACICTPQFAHYAAARPFLERGLPVLIEKPLAQTVEHARLIAQCARAPVAVGLMKAYEPIYRKAEDLLNDGVLGTLTNVEGVALFGQVLRRQRGWVYSKSQAGGGALINAGLHVLHLLYRFAGPVTQVQAQLKQVHSEEVEDECKAQLAFGCGAQGRFFCSWSTPGYDTLYTRITLTGLHGKMEITDDFILLELDETRGEYASGVHQIFRSALQGAPFNLSPDYAGDGYCFEQMDFLDCLPAHQTPRVNLNEGLALQRLIQAIYTAGASGKPVEVSA